MLERLDTDPVTWPPDLLLLYMHLPKHNGEDEFLHPSLIVRNVRAGKMPDGRVAPHRKMLRGPA